MLAAGWSMAQAFVGAVVGRRLNEKAGGGAYHGPKGGEVSMEIPGQHILERTAVVLTKDYIEVCLPACL